MSRSRQFMAWACALPLIGVMICGKPASAATPSLAWNGAKRLGVHCLVDPDTLPDRHRLQASLCERVRTLAADKAPIPVVVLAPGDPDLIAADTTVLLFHGHVQPGEAGRGPLLVFSLRAFRATAAPSELFGAAPRAVPLPPYGGSPSFDSALNTALAETLPWRSPRVP